MAQSRFDARELMAKAEVNAGSERKMTVGRPLEVQAFGILVRRRVHVGGHEHRHDPRVLAEPHAAEIDITAHDTRL